MAKVSKLGLIVKKVGMTRVPDSDGGFVPVTLLKVEKQKVCKVLESEKNGYSAFQVGYHVKSDCRTSKPNMVRLRKCEIEENFSKFREFRLPADDDSYTVGSSVGAELFKDVGYVDVTGYTKGRGFQGAVKRWGASIGRMSHGSRFHRRPGSLGQCTTPGRVFKNKHQPGHMGDEKRTVKNLEVVSVDVEANVIAVRGSVPGNRKAYLEIRETNKGQKQATTSK